MNRIYMKPDEVIRLGGSIKSIVAEIEPMGREVGSILGSLEPEVKKRLGGTEYRITDDLYMLYNMGMDLGTMAQKAGRSFMDEDSSLSRDMDAALKGLQSVAREVAWLNSSDNTRMCASGSAMQQFYRNVSLEMNESEASPVGDYLLSSVKQVVLGWFTEGAKTAKSLIEVTGNLPPWGYYGPPPSGWTGQGASSPSLDTINGVDQGTGNLPPWGYYGPPPSGWTGQGTGKTNDGFAYEWTGTHVTPEFKAKVLEICAKLKMNPDDLMAVMAFESGGINPAAVNKDSGATGLIQFMPSTARSLETTTEALAKMSDVEQLDYVYQYLEPYTGKLNTVQDAYMAVFMPIAVGKSNDFVLGIKDSKEELAKGLSYGIVYKQNAGLDKNGDGIITKEEAAQKVVDKRNTYKKIN